MIQWDRGSNQSEYLHCQLCRVSCWSINYAGGWKLLLKYLLLIVVFSGIVSGNGWCDKIKMTDDTFKYGEIRIAEEQGLLNGENIDLKDISEISFGIDAASDTADQTMQVKYEEPFSIPEVLEFVRKADNLNTPGIKGIIIRDEGRFTWEKDGTSKYRYHFIGRILKEAGRSWGKIGWGFDEDRQKLKILLARSISPDGKTVKYLLESDIMISDPAGESQFFSKYRTLSAVIPGVDNDSIVEYIMETDTFNPMDRNIFSASYYFRDFVPVKTSKVTVRFPAEKEMYYVSRRMSPGKEKPEVSNDKEFKEFSWTMQDVPMIVSEPMMPPYNFIAPEIKCSPFKNWDYLNEFSRKMLIKNISVTPEIEATVKEITAKSRTVEEKIASIYYFCQQEIRYISIKSSFSSGWAGHPAEHTLKNRYGDCIDKSILFATMMKVIGVEAYPVGVNTNNAGDIDVEIPIFDANHAISEVYLEGRRFYLDCTATTYRYPYFRSDDHGIWASNEILGKFNWIDVPPPEDNMYVQVKRLQVKDNGDTVVSYVNEFNGSQEAYSRSFWQSVKESERKRVFQNSVNSINPGAEVIDFSFTEPLDLSIPFSYKARYRLNGYGKIAGNLMIFKIPGFSRSFSSVSLPERKYDLHYDSSDCQKRRTIIDLPENYTIKYLPSSIEINNEYMSYSAHYIVFENQVFFEDELKFKKRIVPVKDYPNFRNSLQEVSRYSDEQIFLEKKEAE